MRVWRQASTVRNAGKEDEDHRDAHGKEGDEEHVGRAAVVVHAPIITYSGENARGIQKKFIAYRKVVRRKARLGSHMGLPGRIDSLMSYKSRDS